MNSLTYDPKPLPAIKLFLTKEKASIGLHQFLPCLTRGHYPLAELLAKMVRCLRKDQKIVSSNPTQDQNLDLRMYNL